MSVKRVQFNSPVILSFSLISLVALALGAVTNGWTTVHFFSVYRAPLSDVLAWLRLFTHVFGHAGYTHFMSNILMLLVVGPPLEEKYGSGNLAACILVTALISGLAQCLFSANTILLGASGIVFMLIVLSSFAGASEGKIPLTLILVLALYLGGEVVDGIRAQDNVSHLTHIIGGLCGAGLGFLLRKRRPAHIEPAQPQEE